MYQQVAKATGKTYSHKDPISEAIVTLIYAQLGSRSLLEKCVHGYTQNANECLHSTVWKFCPKELFLGKLALTQLVLWQCVVSMMVQVP